jgi:hypothetical protein
MGKECSMHEVKKKYKILDGNQEDNIKMKIGMVECGLDSSGSEWGLVAGYC